MSFLNILALGGALVGILPILILQFKSGQKLDSSIIWPEISGLLSAISHAFKLNINLVLAQKVTQAAIDAYNNFVKP